jgi:hypothetical protein
MSAQDNVAWKFLSDEAIADANADCFGVHSAYAKVLLGMCRRAITPFSIGLYGNWGTGKTSVTKILQSLTNKATDNSVNSAHSIKPFFLTTATRKRWSCFTHGLRRQLVVFGKRRCL